MERTTRFDAKQPTEGANEDGCTSCLPKPNMRIKYEGQEVPTLKYDLPHRHRVTRTSASSTAFASVSSSASSDMSTTAPPAPWIRASIARREPSANSSEVERRIRWPAQTRTCSPTLVLPPASPSISAAGFRLRLPSVARGSSSRSRVTPGRNTGGSGQA